MGILRFFLALIVVIAHSKILSITKPLTGDGGLAVEAFFVISGFYMALIFNKYELQTSTISNLYNFYSSRAFRIYPLYFLTILFLLFLQKMHYAPYYHNPMQVLDTLIPLADKIIYLIENIFIFGQALMRFFIYDVNTHSFIFYPISDNVNHILWGSGFAWLGQAWTLSLELTFYLLVPFVLKLNKRIIFLVCLSSFILRCTIHKLGFIGYNIQYAFFPTALGVFLLGSLSYIYLFPYVSRLNPKFNRIIAYAFLLLIYIYAVYLYAIIPKNIVKFWLFVGIIGTSLPFLFAHFKKSIADRYIGELSYPIYITHTLFYALFSYVNDNKFNLLLVVISSVLTSMLLLHLVIYPLDKYRHKRYLSRENKLADLNLTPLISMSK